MGVRFTEKRSVLFLIFALCLATALLSFGTVFYSAEVSGQDKEKAETAPSALGKIAYAMRYSGPVAPQGLLYIANADGTNPTEIGTSPVIAPSQPAWNAAGTKLLFVDTQAPYDIHVINIDGTQRTNLTNTDASIAERNPSWSSNGKIA